MEQNKLIKIIDEYKKHEARKSKERKEQIFLQKKFSRQRKYIKDTQFYIDNAEQTFNSYCFKDQKAFEMSKGICFINEYELQSLSEGKPLIECMNTRRTIKRDCKNFSSRKLDKEKTKKFRYLVYRSFVEVEHSIMKYCRFDVQEAVNEKFYRNADYTLYEEPDVFYNEEEAKKFFADIELRDIKEAFGWASHFYYVDVKRIVCESFDGEDDEWEECKNDYYWAFEWQDEDYSDFPPKEEEDDNIND